MYCEDRIVGPSKYWRVVGGEGEKRARTNPCGFQLRRGKGNDKLRNVWGIKKGKNQGPSTKTGRKLVEKEKTRMWGE